MNEMGSPFRVFIAEGVFIIVVKAGGNLCGINGSILKVLRN